MLQVVGALVAGGLGLPLPEELALITAGYWLARGEHPAIIVCAFVAVLAGDAVMVMAGRHGARLAFARRSIGDARLAELERAFQRHGVVLLLAGRFVPGLRAAMLVAAGAARLPLQRLALVDATAALVGASAWIAVGVALGPRLERARELVGEAHGVALALAAVAVALVLLVRARRRLPSAR